MFEIPTSWESTGINWGGANPLWDVATLNLCMIEAIKERRITTGRPLSILLADTYNPIRPNFDYVSAIHSEVSDLILSFVNNLDHGGDWTGQNTIPNWTEANILTAIGDSARIVPTHLSTLSDWYFQTKKIMDLLVWIKSKYEMHAWGEVEEKGEGISEWQPVFNNINYSNPIEPPYVYNVWGHDLVSFPSYRRRAKPYFIDVPSAFQSSTDIYVYAHHYQEHSYYDILGTAGEDLLKKVETLPESSAAYRVGTRIEPAETPIQLADAYTDGYDMAVHKFDGMGGFKFRAS